MYNVLANDKESAEDNAAQNKEQMDTFSDRTSLRRVRHDAAMQPSDKTDSPNQVCYLTVMTSYYNKFMGKGTRQPAVSLSILLLKLYNESALV